ncbi:MAG TPA: hypothetical protein PKC28_03290 [Bdellovibrionales bacterium]|nr:hypothetical protein [Bdellovibrionales bacterium]
MIKAMLPALALSLMFSGQVFAQEETAAAEGETKMKIEEATDKGNKVDGDIDQEITNAKLRAETGSKSKWSASALVIYYGGSLEEPFSKDRANPVNDPIAPKTTMTGEIGVKYRLNKAQALSLDVGYALERPFHGAERGDVSNPSLKFNNAGKIGAVQNVAGADLYVTTDSDQREIGDLGTFVLSNTMIYDFNGSRAAIGLAVDGQYTQFNKENEIAEPKGQEALPAIAYQQDYQFAAYPFFEYAFNDLVNFRTVFRPWIFSHARADEGFTFQKRPWTQSIGVGFAVTRDIYIYPNFQYDWEKWRRDDYNWARENTREASQVGVQANINVF